MFPVWHENAVEGVRCFWRASGHGPGAAPESWAPSSEVPADPLPALDYYDRADL